MSEIPGGGEGARIIPFPRRGEFADRLALEDLTDAGLIDLFLAPLCHPSRQQNSPEEVADSIRLQLGADLSDEEKTALTDEALRWRKAYLKLSVDTQELEDGTEVTLEAIDPIFHTLSRHLRNPSFEAPEYLAHRQAFEALRDLRLGTIVHEIETTDAYWRGVIKLLTPKLSQLQ